MPTPARAVMATGSGKSFLCAAVVAAFKARATTATTTKPTASR